MSFELTVFLLLFLLVGIVALEKYLELQIRLKRAEAEKAKEYNLLELRISKFEEHSFKDAEQIFNNVAAFLQKIKWKAKRAGKVQPRVSFEILATSTSIRFFIWAEKGQMTNSLTHVLKGKYKSIVIDPIADYMAQAPFTKIDAVSMELTKGDIMPLKLFADMQTTGDTSTDPLAAVTSAISTLQAGEEIWVQYVVSPTGPSWKDEGKKMGTALDNKKYSFWKGRERIMARRSLSTPFWQKMLVSPFRFLGFIISIFKTKPAAEAKPENDPKEAMMKEKAKYPILSSNIRILYGTADTALYRPALMKEITQTYIIFSKPDGNALKANPIQGNSGFIKHIFQKRKLESDTIDYLNSQELSLLWHLPAGSQIHSPYVNFLENSADTSRKYAQENEAKKTEAEELELVPNVPLIMQPVAIPNKSAIGVTESYGKQQIFTIEDADRRRHIYVIGQTGTGKSTLQESMIVADILKGRGVAVIDPHGDLVEKVLKFIPKSRKNDLAYFDPSDLSNPPAFNILSVDKKGKDLLATEILGIFHKMFANSWGPRMEQILYNTLAALIETPGATLVEIPAFITSKSYRDKCLAYCTDQHVTNFWHNQFDVLDPKMQNESVVAVLNKVEKFFNNPIIRYVFASKRNRFNFDFIMNKQKILLVNLSKGRISPQNSELIGSMIVSRLLVDAMKRVEIPEAERKDFCLYIDEFQNFVSSVTTFESILSEARKYRLSLIIAHQYIKQLPEELKAAIFGNVGTIMSLRIGLEDSPIISKQFGGEVTEHQLTSLEPYTLYTRSVKNNRVTGVVKIRAFAPVEQRYAMLTEEEISSMMAISKKQYSWSAEDHKAYEERNKEIQAIQAQELEAKKKKKDKKPGGPGGAPYAPKGQGMPSNSSETTQKNSIDPDKVAAMIEAAKRRSSGN